MEYISAAVAAEKWGVTKRQVQRLLAAGRVPYAQKHGRVWLIPRDEPKPGDLRKSAEHDFLQDVIDTLEKGTQPMPLNNPAKILEFFPEKRVRQQYEARFAYLRGDFQATLDYFFRSDTDEVTKACCISLAMLSAITLGQFKIYQKLTDYYNGYREDATEVIETKLIDLTTSTIAAGAMAPQFIADWIKTGDFDTLPTFLLPDALRLRANYYLIMEQYEAALAVAESALAYQPIAQGISHSWISLQLVCVMACQALERTEEAKARMLETMRVCLPHRFTTPFAELIMRYGGLVEACCREEFPELTGEMVRQGQNIITNWISFVNELTESNLTSILTLREYYIADKVARHVPYAEIARHQGITVGRLKNIVSEIYSKLGISNRNELASYILPSKG